MFETVELLKERRLENGVRLADTTNYPQELRQAARERWARRLPSTATALWGFSEIAENTFFCENPETPAVDDGRIVYASKDGSKRLEINTPEGEVRFVFDTGKEWRNGCNMSLPEDGAEPRFSKGKSWNWPHLLVHQNIQDPNAPDGVLRLGAYDKLRFTFSAELTASEQGEPDQCPPGSWGDVPIENHCLFYVVFVTVHNDREVKLAKDGLKARLIYALYPVFCSYDGATHLCHAPWLGPDPAEEACYWTLVHTGLEVGRRAEVTIDADALARESIDAINQRFDSKLSADSYSISQVIIGWENWGAYRSDIRIRDLSFKAFKHQQHRCESLYQYYNPDTGDHLYSMDHRPEGFAGYRFEKAVGRIPTVALPDTAALFRYFNKASGDHYYTTDGFPFGFTGYVFEGRLGYVFTKEPGPGYVPLHQYWSAAAGDHYYTSDYRPDGFDSYVYEKCLGYMQPPES